MIGALRLEPGDLSAVAAAVARAWDGLREAFRAIAQACVRAAASLYRLVRRYVRVPVEQASLRVHRRAERRRQALMLRQQRRAMKAQRRL